MRNNQNNYKVFLTSLVSLITMLLLFGFLFKGDEARAKRVILKSNDLYTVSAVLGEKRLTEGHDVNIIFAHTKGKILFGKGWEGEFKDSEHIGSTKLFTINEDGGGEEFIANDVVFAFFNSNAQKIFYTTRDLTLYVTEAALINPVKLQEKVLTPDLSPDGMLVTYVKLPQTWEPGEYYDRALGIAILNLTTYKEQMVTNVSEDFNPLWTPNQKKILFFSRSPEGLASHFVIMSNGYDRRQLTNKGEQFVSSNTVSIPSERPRFSQDGRYLIYESDNKIWINEFDLLYNRIIRAKAIINGRDPDWVVDGKIISVVVGDAAFARESLIHVDLQGNIIKR